MRSYRLLAMVAGFTLACGAETDSPPVENSAPQYAAKPKRLASTILLADDTLYAFGDEVRARTVAVSALSDDPRYSETVGQWPKELARVGPNPAEIVALQPDVVFLASFSDQAYRAALEEHFELVVLKSFAGFDDYRANVKTIGAAAGAEAQATELVETFDRRLAAIEAKRPSDAAGWPTCVSWEGGYVAGGRTSFDDAARAAGCRNLVAEKGLEGHQPVDTEQLLAWAPDYLVVSCMGGEASGCAERREQLTQMAGINTLAAVKEGRVLAIPPAQLSSVGAGMLDLAESLASGLRATEAGRPSTPSAG